MKLPDTHHLKAVADAWERATGDSTIDFSESPDGSHLAYVHLAALERLLGVQVVPDRGIPCTINGKDWGCPTALISYEDVVALAHNRPVPGCSVIYHKGAPLKPSGRLAPGQSVPVVAGMRFSAVYTGNA